MQEPKKPVDRRTMLAGAGTVGALAAAAAVLPAVKPPAVVEPASATPPEGAAGYRLTEHVKRYYASTRI